MLLWCGSDRARLGARYAKHFSFDIFLRVLRVLLSFYRCNPGVVLSVSESVSYAKDAINPEVLQVRVLWSGAMEVDALLA